MIGRARAGALVACGVAGSLAACVTTSGILQERGTGEVRCYRVSFDTLWPVTQQAVRHVGLVLESTNRDNGFVIARNYEPEVRDPEEMAVDADAGERVGVFFEDAGPDVWAVEVVSRRIFALDVTARDWTRPVFQAIEDRLPETARDPHPDLAACVRTHERPAASDSTLVRAPPNPGDLGTRAVYMSGSSAVGP